MRNNVNKIRRIILASVILLILLNSFIFEEGTILGLVEIFVVISYLIAALKLDISYEYSFKLSLIFILSALLFYFLEDEFLLQEMLNELSKWSYYFLLSAAVQLFFSIRKND